MKENTRLRCKLVHILLSVSIILHANSLTQVKSTPTFIKHTHVGLTLFIFHLTSNNVCVIIRPLLQAVVILGMPVFSNIQ